MGKGKFGDFEAMKRVIQVGEAHRHLEKAEADRCPHCEDLRNQLVLVTGLIRQVDAEGNADTLHLEMYDQLTKNHYILRMLKVMIDVFVAKVEQDQSCSEETRSWLGSTVEAFRDVSEKLELVLGDD